MSPIRTILFAAEFSERSKGAYVVARCKVAHARELADGIWGIGAIFVTSGAQDAAPVEGAEAKRIAAKMLG